MGFTGLARWVNAPTTGLDLINENILKNHHGQYRGKWQLTIRSFRSTLATIPGLQILSERSMCTLTMNENVFVLLEDPLALARTGFEGENTSQEQIPTPSGAPHYRTTFVTLTPPGALEQLLAQLKARWVPVRQSASSAPQRGQSVGQQVVVEGNIFSIGTDWLVRVGNVILAGGALKGMLLEAEYLPLPTLRSQTADGTSELLSNLLTSILPNIKDAKTVAVTISDSQQEELLWDREETGRGDREVGTEQPELDDIYAFGEEALPRKNEGGWIGVERDRRSAFLIMGALKSEGIL